MSSRRDVLRKLAMLTGSSLVPWTLLGADGGTGTSDKLGPVLPRRQLGRTTLSVTMLAVGGSHVGRLYPAEAQRVIETAIARGVRTFDTAELYQRGGSEERYGQFLTPKYREHVQIFTKTMARDGRTAERHLAESLRRLKTDYIDLWQMHDVRTEADVEACLKNGVLDVMLVARESGKVRHIGFTGHANHRTHLHMLQQTDLLETCLMPMNVLDPSHESFVLHVLPVLVERGMGVQAMKTLAYGRMLSPRGGGAIIPDRLSVQEALRFVWSLPVAALVSGMDSVAVVEENARHAREFLQLDAAGRQALIDKVADIAATGSIEYYKEG